MTPAEEIKAKLDLVEVIRDYIPVKAAGVNFRARCPFHNEKTPSLMISPDKQIWHCFGCGKGGDVFDFVANMENLQFSEVLRLLAVKAGVVLNKSGFIEQTKRNRLLDILEAAAIFFQRNLRTSPQAESARQYLISRGLNDQILEEWRIGYSLLSWDDLIIYLKGKGWRDEDIFDAGLSTKKQSGSGYLNRFRERIIFPICDLNGNVVGFTGRVLPDKEKEATMGKYVNTPSTEVYDKSKIIFGLYQAKAAIRKAGSVIVVEGQMDCITSHQFGFTNTIATSGTALTEDQLKIIKRFTDNLFLAFDSDQGGSLAIDRATALALSQDFNVKIVRWSSGKDPDEVIRLSSDQWQYYLTKALPAVEYYLAKARQEYDLTESNGRRSAAKMILPLIDKIANPLERDFWLKKLSNLLDINVAILQEALNRKRQPENQFSSFFTTVRNKESALSESLLALLMRFPIWLPMMYDYLKPEEVPSDEYRAIYSQLLIYYNKKQGQAIIEDRDFRYWLNTQNDQSLSDLIPIVDRLILLGERDFYQLSADEAKAEIIKIATSLHRNYIASRLKDLTQMISGLEKAQKEGRQEVGDQEKINDLMNEFNNLTRELTK